MKYLVFIGAFVGEENAGSFRMERFIKKALELDIPVIYIKPSGVYRGVFKFFRIQDLTSYLCLIKEKKKTHKGSVRDGKISSLLRKLKYLLYLDVLNITLLRTFRMLLALSNFDQNKLVYLVSSPPISIALATRLFQSIYKIKYVVDMRDAWAYHPQFNHVNIIRQKIEKYILSSSEMILTVSNFLRDEFEKNNKNSTLLLYNVDTQTIGYNRSTLNRKTTDIVNIVYVGSTPDGFYDLTLFCNGVKSYYNTNPPLKLYFIFYGPCKNLENKINQNYPELIPLFEFHSQVSHEYASQVVANSDIVLLFGFNGDRNCGVVGTKIFEYLQSRKPILPIDIRSKSDLEHIITDASGFCPLLNDAESLKSILLCLSESLQVLPAAKDVYDSSKYESPYNDFIQSLINV